MSTQRPARVLLCVLLVLLLSAVPVRGAEEIHDPAGCDYSPCEARWGPGPHDDRPIPN